MKVSTQYIIVTSGIYIEFTSFIINYLERIGISPLSVAISVRLTFHLRVFPLECYKVFEKFVKTQVRRYLTVGSVEWEK